MVSEHSYGQMVVFIRVSGGTAEKMEEGNSQV
jgi:hypothetical protein